MGYKSYIQETRLCLNVGQFSLLLQKYSVITFHCNCFTSADKFEYRCHHLIGWFVGLCHKACGAKFLADCSETW